MTIAKGEPWGTPGALPANGVVARSDADARTVIEQSRRANIAVPPIGLVGGDLCRTLGGTGDGERLRSPDAVTFPIDIGAVLVDGRLHWFVAHVVAHNRWWTRTWLAMNAQWLGPLNLAPRAHPDDAVLDVFDARLPIAELWKVRSRARHGAHLPHPGIGERRVAAAQVTFERPLRVFIDGVSIGTARNLSVRIEPDAASVVI